MVERDCALLSFIDVFEYERGYCPTFDEMAAATFNSMSSLERALTRLEAAKLIRRLPRKACAIEIIRPARKPVAITPILVSIFEQIDEYRRKVEHDR